MSYLPINEQNQQAPTGATTNAPTVGPPPQTSGTAGASPGAAPKGASTGTPTQFGSSASKLGDYLSANAPQITQQANTVAGNLNQTYGTVSQGITDAANQFGQQVQGGYAASNPDVINQAMQNPGTFASNPSNVQAFQGQYNDAYTGPLAFESTSPYSDIQNQVSQAVQQGNLLGTQAGLQSYLQGQGPNPSQASATLDTLLLQGNPQAQATIQNAAGQLGNLQGQLQTATQNADQSVLDAQNAAQAANTYAQGQFNPYVQNFGQTLGNELASAQGVYGNQLTNQNALQQVLSNNPNSLTPEMAASLNIDPAAYTALVNEMNQYAGIYGSAPENLGNYLTLGNAGQGGPPTLSNTATNQEYATAQALGQLLGQAYQNPLNPANVAQAGTANQGYQPGSFDLSGATQGASNAFSNADINALLALAPNMGHFLGVDPSLSNLYNPTVQADAATMLGQSHTPGFNFPSNSKAFTDALTRLAQNSYL